MVNKILSLDSISDSVGAEVNVVGKIKNIRKKGKLIFFEIEKGNNTVQVASFGKTSASYNRGDIISVSGKVVFNKGIKTGISQHEISTNPNGIEVLHIANSVNKRDKFESKHKYTDLEHRGLFKAKSEFLHSIREYFYSNRFCEVNSPTIVGDICKGPVPDFKVEYFGRDASLSVSNILYHHMFMTSFDRVYELNKVFRGSPSDTSRHVSEIQMLDFALQDINLETTVDMMDEMLKSLVNVLENNGVETNLSKNDDIPRFTFNELCKYLSGKGVSPISEPHDLRTNFEAQQVLPKYIWIFNSPREGYNFFTKSFEEDGSLYSCDAQLRLVSGGQLISGGVREVNLERVLQAIEYGGYDVDWYKPYLEAVEYGVMPHVGMGMGIDRVFSALADVKSIKDTIFFKRDTRKNFVEEI